MSEKVYVTGAGGFIGRRLCASLEAAGAWVRRGGRGDVNLAGCAGLVHLAHPMDTASVEALFRAAAEGPIRRVVLMSSVKAVAERSAPGVPLTESDPPRPETDYGRRKLEVERQAAAWAAEGFELTILRPPVVHGRGARGALAALAKAVRSGLPLPLGGIDNARSVVGRDNLADAVWACLRSPAAAGRAFFVADGPPVSTPQLVRLMAVAAGRRARVLPAPTSLLRLSADLRRLVEDLAVDDSALREVVGWRPPRPLVDGLIELMDGV